VLPAVELNSDVAPVRSELPLSVAAPPATSWIADVADEPVGGGGSDEDEVGAGELSFVPVVDPEFGVDV
jgi:hypothetical protein